MVGVSIFLNSPSPNPLPRAGEGFQGLITPASDGLIPTPLPLCFITLSRTRERAGVRVLKRHSPRSILAKRKFRIRRPDIYRIEFELFADDVGALHKRDTFVLCDASR